MGEHQVAMMSKWPRRQVEMLDAERMRWWPTPSRSSMIRDLSAVGMYVFIAGIISRNPEQVQRLLSSFAEPQITAITGLYPWHGIARSAEEAHAFMGDLLGAICKVETIVGAGSLPQLSDEPRPTPTAPIPKPGPMHAARPDKKRRMA